ncbi:hypothetical protein BGZ57DRAFT_849865 [Hyaloscypha finlandica]|nr:hypothetical protein BGZ57DRAFT_849865 [Hyaloscypha finlandica]
MIGRRILAVPSDSSNWPGQLSCGFASFMGTTGLALEQGARCSRRWRWCCAGAGAGDGVRRTAFTTPSFALPSGHPRGNSRDLNFLSGQLPSPRRSALGLPLDKAGEVESEGCPPAGFPRGLPTLHVKARLQRPGMAPLALAWLPAGYPSEPLAPLAPHPQRQTSCKAPLSAPARCTLARPQPRSFNGGLIVAGIGLSLPHLDSPRPDLTRRFSQRAQQP